jgi:hypothetical protein
MPRLSLAWALLAALILPPGLSAQPPETFSESLVIREREILVDVPDLLADDRLSPADFRVLVEGTPREVTRAEPAGGDWTILIYVDQILARPGTVFYSGLALANRARELTGAGSVEVAVAGSDPRVVLASTREAKSIERTLTDLSAAARVERDRTEGPAGRSGEPSLLQIRRQHDKLLAFLAARRPSGPRAVFLVVDGPSLTPEQTALLERPDPPKDPPAGMDTPASVFHRTARLLAAYGWVTIPVPLRKEGAGSPIAPKSEIEIFRQSSAPSDHQNGVPPILPGRPPAKTTLAFTGVIDLFIKPQTAALRILSRATAGSIIGFEQQVEPALAALSRRWRLWLAEPDGPVDGRLHPVEVSLAARRSVGVQSYSVEVGPAGKTKSVRAPGWIRSSTPEEIAEARLEDLLAGQAGAGDLPFSAAVQRMPAGLELRVEVFPLQVPESAPSGPVRISWSFSGEEGAATVHHETVSGKDLDKGSRQTFRIHPPPGARRIAVVVEALGPERWGGTVLAAGP